MPIIASAKKKLRQDEKRNQINVVAREALKKAMREARRSRTPKNVQAAFSALDTAAKKHIIHKNKAARLKSQLSKPVAKAVTT